jgi:hypothetical protein
VSCEETVIIMADADLQPLVADRGEIYRPRNRRAEWEGECSWFNIKGMIRFSQQRYR